MAIEDDAVKTQGTQLYFVDHSGSQPAVIKLNCPTGITGLMGGSVDKIPLDCLEYTGKYRKTLTGQGDAGDVSVPFILTPSNASQRALFALQRSAAVIEWMVADSKGTNAPTLDSNDEMVPPTDRNSYALLASVSNLQLDASGNEVWRGTLTLSPSGDTQESWASA